MLDADSWRSSVKDWGGFRLADYIEWVIDTYGEEEANKLFAHADSYRAVMDVKNSVEEPIDRQPTQILTSASMVKAAQEILNNAMKDVYDKHEYNQPRL